MCNREPASPLPRLRSIGRFLLSLPGDEIGPVPKLESKVLIRARFEGLHRPYSARLFQGITTICTPVTAFWEVSNEA